MLDRIVIDQSFQDCHIYTRFSFFSFEGGVIGPGSAPFVHYGHDINYYAKLLLVLRKTATKMVPHSEWPL